MLRKSRIIRQFSAQQRALAKASAGQESSSIAYDSKLKDPSLSDYNIMIIEVE